jgi:hypothetical protein
VVRYGDDVNPNQFPDVRVDPKEGAERKSSGNVSPLFQPRQPPRGTRSAASAY